MIIDVDDCEYRQVSYPADMWATMICVRSHDRPSTCCVVTERNSNSTKGNRNLNLFAVVHFLSMYTHFKQRHTIIAAWIQEIKEHRTRGTFQFSLAYVVLSTRCLYT